MLLQETVLFNSGFSLLALSILGQERLCSQDHRIEHIWPLINENQLETTDTDETSAQAD